MRCSYTGNLLLSGTVKGIHLHAYESGFAHTSKLTATVFLEVKGAHIRSFLLKHTILILIKIIASIMTYVNRGGPKPKIFSEKSICSVHIILIP